MREPHALDPRADASRRGGDSLSPLRILSCIGPIQRYLHLTAFSEKRDSTTQMKNKFFGVGFAISLALAGAESTSIAQGSARLSRDAINSSEGIVLEGSDQLSTIGSFQPPVDITIIAKTDSTDLRIVYAANQVIFNWEKNMDELRVDGGPADGKHKMGAGRIPTGKYVLIRWVVTPENQAIYVDNELRFEHRGDYSQINRNVSVFTSPNAKVTVKSIQVKRLAGKRR